MTDQPSDVASAGGQDAKADPKKDAGHISPLLKLVLEIGPLVIYFLSFRQMNDPDVPGSDFTALLWATGFFMVALAISLGVTWYLTKQLSRIAVLTAIVVLVMFVLTYLLNDETFIKMKPTIVNTLFAIILGIGLLQGRSYLQYLMDELMPLDDEGWMKFTRNWMLFFVFLAILNEIIWRNVSTETWLAAKFINPVLSIAFVISQMPLLKRHMTGDDDAKA